jgi:hypothetical protein
MTIQLDQIYSLTEFQRNSKDHIRRMKKSGQPQVLTINGKAELVVQDAASYQKLLDAIDHAEAIVAIQRGLEAHRRGNTLPAVESLEKLGRKYGIARPHRSRRSA